MIIRLFKCTTSLKKKEVDSLIEMKKNNEIQFLRSRWQGAGGH